MDNALDIIFMDFAKILNEKGLLQDSVTMREILDCSDIIKEKECFKHFVHYHFCDCQKEKSMSEWIKVNAKNPKPKCREQCWGFWNDTEVTILEHYLTDEQYVKLCTDGHWYSIEDNKLGNCTHWQPLIKPEPPKE